MPAIYEPFVRMLCARGDHQDALPLARWRCRRCLALHNLSFFVGSALNADAVGERHIKAKSLLQRREALVVLVLRLDSS